MKNWLKEVYMYILGAIVICGFFTVLIIKLMNNQNAELEIGALISMASAVVGYFYGSSKGSSDKTNIIANGGKPTE